MSAGRGTRRRLPQQVWSAEGTGTPRHACECESNPCLRSSGQKASTQRTHETSNPGAARVLVADDQPDVREALRLLLKNEGYEIQTASSPADIMSALEAREFDIVLMDLNYARDTTSGEEGLDLLTRIQTIDSALPVVVMTAWGSVQLAVEAMRRGARDFIQKPWENARLIAILRTQVELAQIPAPPDSPGSRKSPPSRRFPSQFSLPNPRRCVPCLI